MSIDVSQHLGLAVLLVKRFHRPRGVDFEELVSVAFLAMVEAAKGFNPDKNTKLSTWLTKPVGWRVSRS